MSSSSGYSSLYRRFRPQRFSEVLGQDHVTKALRNAVATKKVSHAYLFSGPRGTGKTSTARILAKALNCANLDAGEPCGICDSCVSVAEGRSMDVLEVDAASNSGVDAIRTLISQAPVGTVGEWKVYILDEVHMLTAAASNALLKTLEEPPSHVIFVLATTDPQKVLPTILSRTQSFEFRLLDTAVLESLVEQVRKDADLSVQAAELDWAVKKGQGSARDTLSYLDQVVALGGVDDSVRGIEEIFAAIARGDGAGVLIGVRSAVAKGLEPARISAEVVSMARDQFLDSFDAKAADPALSTARLVKIVESLGAITGQLRDSLDPRATVEAALIRLAHDKLGVPSEVEELIHKSVASQLARLAGASRVPASSAAAVAPAPDSEILARDQAESEPRYEPRRAPTSPPPGLIANARSQLASTQPKTTPANGLAKVEASKLRAGGTSPESKMQGPPPTPQNLELPVGHGAFDRDRLVAQWPKIIASMADLAPLERSSLNQGRFTAADSKSATFLVENSIVRDRCITFAPKIQAAIARYFGLDGFRFMVEVDSLPPTHPPEESSHAELMSDYAKGTTVDKDSLARTIRDVFPSAVEIPKP